MENKIHKRSQSCVRWARTGEKGGGVKKRHRMMQNAIGKVFCRRWGATRYQTSEPGGRLDDAPKPKKTSPFSTVPERNLGELQAVQKDKQGAPPGCLCACLKGNSDADCRHRRDGWEGIGYFALTLFTPPGEHERHYEFIGSGDPNELPSPGFT